MGLDYKPSFWDEGTPSGTSRVDQINEAFASLKSSLRSIIGEEHTFNSAVADHVRGTHLKGSARAFMDVESNMSVSGTSYIGRLYVASDTSRLFAIPDSGLTMYLGSASGLEHATWPSQNTHWVVESGTDSSAADVADGRVAFTTSFGANPSVILTSVGTRSDNPVTAMLTALDTSGFTYVTLVASNKSALAITVHYHVVGQALF